MNMQENYYYSLREAIEIKDIQRVRDMLATGGNINKRDCGSLKNTPLHRAAILDVNVTKLLIDAGADLTLKNYCGRTPLEKSLHDYCDLDIVRVLLDAHEGDVNVKGDHGRSPLNHAASTNNKDMVQYLLSRGADVNIVDEDTDTPLHMAAFCNKTESHKEIIELLLKNGASVNAKNRDGYTPLQELLRLGNPTVELVKLFLESEADVNLKDSQNQNPLLIAASNAKLAPNIEIFQMLIDYGSDVNCAGIFDGSTPLHRCCYYEKLFKYLLKSGAKLEILDLNGYTPAMRFFTREIKSVKPLLFLFKYADVNKVALSGRNILNNNRKPNVWKIVLEHFAKLQAQNVTMQEPILKTISNREDYKSYFEQCAKELQIAKDTKLQKSRLTFFDLLVDNKRKLKNYVGNQDLIKDFQRSNCKKKFPIYGASIQKNVTKGIKRRELFNRSADLLRGSLPIFNPMRLVIKNVLDCIESTKELSKLCERNLRKTK